MVFLSSLLVSIFSFTYNRHSARVGQTEKLHEYWWSDEMVKTRDEVYAICRSLHHGGAAAKAFAEYYRNPLQIAEPPGRGAFAKLVGFFTNLEICMAAGVIDQKIACRLFSEAHYADYEPLIATLRQMVLESDTGAKKLPQWLQITVELENRFKLHGAKLDR